MRQRAASGSRLDVASDCGALLRLCRRRGIESPVTLFDTASALVPRNHDADMVWSSALAGSGDFPLRLAVSQGKDLFAEGRCGALAANWSCGRGTRAPG